MTLPQTELVMDTIDCLMAVSGSAAAPSDAAQRLHRIEARYPRTQLRLLWQQIGDDDLFHYDALLQLPEGGTLSLGFCRELSLPWLMQGAHRWSDADLLRVRETVLTVDQAIAQFDFASPDGAMAQRLIDACLVQDELNRRPVEVSDAELQRAMDGFRRAHRLYSGADTQRWMAMRGIKHADLERLVSGHAAVAGLRERLTADRVGDYFERHHADFDVAHVAVICFPDPGSARQAYLSVRAGTVEFFALAQSRFLEQAAMGSDEPTTSLLQTLQRGRRPTPMCASVFEAAVGDLVGPIDADGCSSVVRVLGFAPASLDDRTRAMIQGLLFDEWLQGQRQTADIEWQRGRGRR
jgi:putative peptide maturation system protein